MILIYNSRENRPLLGCADAGWTGNIEDRKSTSPYIMQVGIHMDVQYYHGVQANSNDVCGRGVAEVRWIKNLLQELGIECFLRAYKQTGIRSMYEGTK